MKYAVPVLKAELTSLSYAGSKVIQPSVLMLGGECSSLTWRQ